MKKIFGYLLTYKRSMWIALFLMAVELVVELVQPLIMAAIIDEGVMTRDLGVVIKWGSLLLGLSLIAFIAGIVSSFFASGVSQGVGYDLRGDLYKKVQQFSTSHIQRFSTSSLITRMTIDVTQVQAFIFMGLRIMLRAPLFIMIGIVMALMIHARLASVFVIAVPVLIILMLYIVSRGVKYFKRVQEKLDTVNSVIQENLIGMRLVKAYNRGSHEDKRFGKVNKSLMEQNVKALRLMELATPIIIFGMNFSIVLILWFGSFELNAGTAQPGEIVAILNYGTRIMGAIGMFGFLIMNFSRGKASATRISNVLVEQEDEELMEQGNRNPQLVKGEVSFQNVTFHYPSYESPALQNVTFSINEGETVGILGETGSGKSSLIQLIPRLFEVSSGEILIDQKDVYDWDVAQLRRVVGLVPQEAHLFTGTIRENIKWGNEEASLEEVMEAAKSANIHDFIMTLPEQYETLVGQRGVNLSGGQKQRLSLARALVRDPKILLLDDSTSALDAHTEAEILETLKKKACTTIIVAQKISSVKEADKILLLSDGQLVASGSHDQLYKTNPYYRDIYKSQIQEEVLEYGD
ncbi:ATP-binding cassette subfamily B protein [Salirhabdus euzebyi]|uniref:ATP-binding cassette subfamily B protein n=1 Tax=Salirhabdus euzebyi TaxID=394506 RepID=A0A841Q5V9_9BACI|nr:ABC transporter ATP-binding protein [Salirhabdus euzebyi]MBB6453788.1 ATP-binding cassette subfamily B protein [Salirhabdus euzebyi]